MYRVSKMSKRGFIRLISFLTAGVIAFAVMALVYQLRNTAAKRHIEYNYLRSLESLSLSIDNIKNSLNKGIYSNSPQMMSDISGRMSSDASAAKLTLSQLPVTELNLENTNKFLSQVGNYAGSIAQRFSKGDELTATDRENLVKLLDYAETLSTELWGVENMVSGGHLSFEEVVQVALEAGDSEPYPGNISGGFENVENLFDGYPSLVYDGQFSDHISKKEPLMLKGAKPVSKETSLETAKKVSNTDNLEYGSEQGGKIPSYTYTNGDTTVSITKDGGYFISMLKYRRIAEKAISTEKAIALAEEYLVKVGYDNMVRTYYEFTGGVCTVNFAGLVDGFTVYTDLIKVEVALDNGEIMSFDARGFISGHHIREKRVPVLTEEEAAEKLSTYLTVEKTKLAVIPSLGEHERFTYEFMCKAENGNNVLVYINADTGHEEQILLLKMSDNGTFVV